MEEGSCWKGTNVVLCWRILAESIWLKKCQINAVGSLLSPDGVLSVNSFYLLLHVPMTLNLDPMYNRIWSFIAPSNVKAFIVYCFLVFFLFHFVLRVGVSLLPLLMQFIGLSKKK